MLQGLYPVTNSNYLRMIKEMSNSKSFFWNESPPARDGSRERGLFLDLGANYGQSVVAFLNWKGQETYNFDVYSFEPNIEFIPGWIDRVMPLQGQFSSINLIPAAVGSSETTSLIYFDGWQLSEFGGVDQRKRAVISFDFVSWFREISASYKQILLKMDIEGAEYNLVSRLADEGLLIRVSQLFIEIHGHKRGYSERETQRLIAQIYKCGLTPLMWEACAQTNTLKYDPQSFFARITTELEHLNVVRDFNGIHKYTIESANQIAIS
jgi:FkbM family methyltransferase